MSTGIGMVSQGEFMSSKSLVEAARIVLSAAPHGLSEEMLVHVLLLDDRPFVGLGAHVYGARSKSRNALGNKGLAALRRTKGMSKRDGRWFYDGPLPSGDKVADGEAVVRVASSSPGTRCCKGCGAILRRGNIDEFCWPCETPRVRDYKIREYKQPPVPSVPRKPRKWTPDLVAASIKKWAEANGRPPARSDWRRTSHGNSNLPSVNTVISVFGSWNGGIEAAGFEPRPFKAGPRTGSSQMWLDLMEVLPASARVAAAGIDRKAAATRKALSRMEAAGWVYRVQVDGPGDRVVWHPMPQGMEAAA